MKFGQLIECNKRNIFLQKLCIDIIKCDKSWWSLRIIIDFALLRVTPTLFLIDNNIELDSYQFWIDKVDGLPP